MRSKIEANEYKDYILGFNMYRKILDTLFLTKIYFQNGFLREEILMYQM